MEPRDALEDWFTEAERRVQALELSPRWERLGRVEEIGDGVATVSGLADLRMDELVRFENGTMGLTTVLERDRIGCLLLGTQSGIRAGGRVHATGAVVRVPVGPAFLGRTVDPLGRTLDGGDSPEAEREDPVDRAAPAIVDRELVTEPLHTGLLVVDTMFPIGRGQRELIIGDRATGKSAFALDVLISQRGSDVICVYVSIGQQAASVKQAEAAVRAHGAPERTIFVIAPADAPPGLQWLAPFAGFTLAEYFSDSGRAALVVLDDLSRHAAVHREIALLLRQPVGREAFPADVFHLHARILERAAHLSSERGGGSLTALPIAETQGGDVSAYIPTNLISIADGQIVLDTRLYNEGIKPAVDVGRSVSRVGGKTQPRAMHHLAERLRLEYAQFLELESFTRLGAVADERTRRRLEHGRRIRALLTQPRFHPIPLAEQVTLLLALEAGVLDGLPLEWIPAFRARLGESLRDRAGEASNQVAQTGQLGPDARDALLEAARGLANALRTGSVEGAHG